jgi:hypothetical protein
LRENSAFVRYSAAQNVIECGYSVGSDEQQVVTRFIDVPHLASRMQSQCGKFGLGEDRAQARLVFLQGVTGDSYSIPRRSFVNAMRDKQNTLLHFPSDGQKICARLSQKNAVSCFLSLTLGEDVGVSVEEKLSTATISDRGKKKKVSTHSTGEESRLNDGERKNSKTCPRAGNDRPRDSLSQHSQESIRTVLEIRKYFCNIPIAEMAIDSFT